MSAWISRLGREDIVRRMSRSLRPLPSDEFLACAAARAACYVRADIAPGDVAANDAEALRVERLRREVYAAIERDEAAGTDDIWGGQDARWAAWLRAPKMEAA